MTPTQNSDAVETRRSYDDETPVAAVVDAVTDVTGDSPVEIDPLGEAVDTDALNALFDSRSTSASVTFEYCGQRVTLTPDDVRVGPANVSE